jgi:hypothetical protein
VVLSEPAVSLPRKSRPSPSSGTSILPQRVPSAIDSARCGAASQSAAKPLAGALLCRVPVTYMVFGVDIDSNRLACWLLRGRLLKSGRRLWSARQLLLGLSFDTSWRRFHKSA